MLRMTTDLGQIIMIKQNLIPIMYKIATTEREQIVIYNCHV